MKRFGRIAGRGRVAVAKKLAGHQKILVQVEGVSRPHQPFITMQVSHVVRRQQNNVVVRGIHMAVGSIHDTRFRQHDPTLGVKVPDQKNMAFRLERRFPTLLREERKDADAEACKQQQ